MTVIRKSVSVPVFRRRVKIPALFLLAVLLVMTALTAASIGAVSIPLGDILSFDLSEQQQAVLSSIRFPRVLLAVIVGASLAISGSAMQGLFRNPLADPGERGACRCHCYCPGRAYLRILRFIWSQLRRICRGADRLLSDFPAGPPDRRFFGHLYAADRDCH